MSTATTSAPRVARIEVHYEDGSKDVMTPVPKNGTEIPLYGWTRSSPTSSFKDHAYSSGDLAVVLFQTALTRRHMDSNPRDKDSLALALGFAHLWQDLEYPPYKVGGGDNA